MTYTAPSALYKLLDQGYSMREVQGLAKNTYDALLAEGYEEKETDELVASQLGFRFGPNPDLGDQVDFLESLVTRDGPKTVSQRMVDLTVRDLSEKERYNKEMIAYNERKEKATAVSVDSKGVATKPVEIPPPEPPKPPSFDIQIPMKSMVPSEVTDFGDSLISGFSHSNTSVAMWGPPTTELSQNAPFTSKVASLIGQTVGDIPWYAAGATLTAPAAAASGPYAPAVAMAGAMAFTETTRQAMMEYYQAKDGMTFGDYLDSAGRIALAGGKAATIGAITGRMGQIIGQAALAQGLSNKTSMIAQVLTEANAMGWSAAAVDQVIPSLEDFALNGLSIAGPRMAGLYTNKLMMEYQRTGKPPSQIIQDVRQNPDILANFGSSNLHSTQGNFRSAWTPVRQTPLANTIPTKGKVIYLSDRVAEDAVRTMNESNGVGSNDPNSYSAQEVILSEDAKVIHLTGGSTSPMARRIYDQFNEFIHNEDIQLINPGAPYEYVRPVSRSNSKYPEYLSKVAAVMENPTDRFIEWAMNNEIQITEEKFTTGIQGIRVDNRVTIFDENLLASPQKVTYTHKPFEVAAKDLYESISVGEPSTKPGFIQTVHNTYSKLFDDQHALDFGVEATGQHSMPYLQGRLLKGADGITEYFFNVGTVAFTGRTIDNITPRATKSGVSFKEMLDAAKYGQPYSLLDRLSGRVKPLPPVSGIMKDALNKVNSTIATSDLEGLKELEKTEGHNWNPLEKNAVEVYRRELEANLKGTNNPLYDFTAYMAAHHAADLHRANIETGMDRQAIHSIVTNGALRARFAYPARLLREYQKALLKYQVDSGDISQKTMDKMLKDHPYYIPFQRVVEDAGGVYATGRRELRGSKRPIIDPFESLVRQTQFVIHSSEANWVKRQIAETYGRPEGETKELPREGYAMTFAEERAAKEKAIRLRQPNVIKYRVDGQEVAHEVPLPIYEVVKNMDKDSYKFGNPIIKALETGASFLRLGSTLPLSFGVKNISMDQLTTYIQNGNYRPFIDWFKGLAAHTSYATGKLVFPKWGALYEQWLLEGGSNAHFLGQDRSATQEMLKTIVKTSNPINSVPFSIYGIQSLIKLINPINVGSKTLDMLRSFSKVSEEGTRVGLFGRLLEAGHDPMTAAFLSREGSIDFARSGLTIRALNNMSVFLNANMQGPDRFIRQFRQDPQGTMARIAIGIVLPSVFFSLAEQDFMARDPDGVVTRALQEVPDWERNAYWIVPTPFGIFRVPKPHEYGLVFANPVENLFRYIASKDPGKSYMKMLFDSKYFETAADKFLVSPASLFNVLLPTAPKVFGEVAMNHSLFTNSSIAPPQMEKRLPRDRYNMHTTAQSKAISNILDKIFTPVGPMAQRVISPVGLDYMIGGLTGTLGKELMSIVDTGLKMLTKDENKLTAKDIEDMDDDPVRLERWPLIRAFMVKYPEGGSKSIDRFYERSKRMEETYNSIVFRAQQGNIAAAHELETIPYGKFSNMRKSFTNMTRLMNFTRQRVDIDEEERRQQIEQQWYNTIDFAREGLKFLDSLERAAEERKRANP